MKHDVVIHNSRACTQTERQTDRETDRQRDRQSGRERYRQRDRHRQTDIYSFRTSFIRIFVVFDLYVSVDGHLA